MQTQGWKIRFSPQEALVCTYICRGKTNVEIAGEMGISVFTIKQYLRVIYDVLQITSRLELCLWASQHPEAWFSREWVDPAMHKRKCECDSLYCRAMRPRRKAA